MPKPRVVIPARKKPGPEELFPPPVFGTENVAV